MAYETITTNKFLTNFHDLIKVKFHLHHSHITRKIFGYTHDFCNTAVIDQTQPDIPLIAHNLFSFDVYFFMKAYIASAWCSESLQIGGSNLTQINYANITGEIKFIDPLKSYKKSLAYLASTLYDEEITTVKKLTERFFHERYYFSTVWPYLNSKKKEGILEIVSEGKGVIPYEIIVDMEPFFIKPWRKQNFLAS